MKTENETSAKGRYTLVVVPVGEEANRQIVEYLGQKSIVCECCGEHGYEVSAKEMVEIRMCNLDGRFRFKYLIKVEGRPAPIELLDENLNNYFRLCQKSSEITSEVLSSSVFKVKKDPPYYDSVISDPKLLPKVPKKIKPTKARLR